VLVPAEPEKADDPLRYFETDAASDGAFEIAHVPPGTYRVFARARAPESERRGALFAWDAARRKELLRLAAAGPAIELPGCKRTENAVAPLVVTVKE
jgi:hypothetical protein